MRVILLTLSALLFVGCATGYKKANTGGTLWGYSDSKVSSDTYRVSYVAKDSPLAYKLFLRRAAEIAKNSGKDYFLVENGTSGQAQGGCMGCTLPQYDGTVKLLSEPVDGSKNVNEILSEYKKK